MGTVLLCSEKNTEEPSPCVIFCVRNEDMS